MKSGLQFSLERLWSSARSMGVWEWCRFLYITFNAILAVALTIYALWIHWSSPQGDQGRLAIILFVLAIAVVCLIAVQVAVKVVAEEKWDWPLWTTVIFVVLGIGVSLLFANWTDLRGEDSNSTTIRNMALVLGGVIAGILALWRSIVAERQADTAQQSLLNERYQKGAEMLGSEDLTVRLGGIYALEQLAMENPEQYHVQVMKLFCAFTRNPTEDKDYEKKLDERNADRLTSPREDVQASIDAIGSRDKRRVKIEKSQGFSLNLIGASLSGVHIAEANLSGAMLDDAVMQGAKLREVDFTDARAPGVNLSGALIHQQVKPLFELHRANLACAGLDRINLSGKRIRGTNLRQARIRFSELSSTLLTKCDLTGAQIFESNLSIAQILSTDMSGTTLPSTDISGTFFYNPYSGSNPSPVVGLTQTQLDEACADLNNPPKLDHVFDAETGKPLVWRGKPCKDD